MIKSMDSQMERKLRAASSLISALYNPPSPEAIENDRLACEIGKERWARIKNIANKSGESPRRIIDFLHQINIAEMVGVEKKKLYQMFNFAINQDAIAEVWFVLQQEVHGRSRDNLKTLIANVACMRGEKP